MKTIQWLMKLAITAIVTSMCCVVMTFLAVSSYVDLLLDQYHIQRPTGSAISWSPFAGRLAAQFGLGGTSAAVAGKAGDSGKSAAGVKPEERTAGSGAGQPSAEGTAAAGGAVGAGGAPTASGDPAKEPDKLAVAANAGTTGGQAPSGDAGQAAKEQPSSGSGAGGSSPAAADKYRVPEDAVAVWSRQSSSAASGQSQQQKQAASDADRRVVMSSEEFAKKKDQLTEKDKAKVFSMLVSRVPQEEMQKISKLLEDGITATELKELEKLLQSRLRPEEYTELLGLLGAKATQP